VRPTITDRDFTIATIAAPAGLKAEEEPESEVVTEVIRKKEEPKEGGEA
jgi:large subunit ribosomal protein L25